MEGIARRTRSRGADSGSMRSSLRGGGGEDGKARVSADPSMFGFHEDGDSAAPSCLVFIIDDDGEERGGGGSVSEDTPIGTRTRSRYRLGKGDSQTPATSNWRPFIAGSNSKWPSDREAEDEEVAARKRNVRCSDSEGDDQEVAVVLGEARNSDREEEDQGMAAGEKEIPESCMGLSCIAKRTTSQIGKETPLYCTSHFKEVESIDSDGDDVDEDDESCKESDNAVADNTETTSKIGERGSVSEDTPIWTRTRSQYRLGKGASETPATSNRRAFIAGSNSKWPPVREAEDEEVTAGKGSVRCSGSEWGDQEVTVLLGEARNSDREEKDQVVTAGEGEIPESCLDFTCIARRTRSQIGKETPYYTSHFKEIESDDSEEDDVEENDESCKENDNAVTYSTDITSKIGDACGKEGETFGGDFLKKKKFGINILVSARNENMYSEGKISGGISQRTRSHFEATNEKKKFGTVSNPYQLDMCESETESDSGSSSCGEDDEGERSGDDHTCRCDGVEMDIDGREEGMGQAGLRQGRSNKRNEMDVDGIEEEMGQAGLRQGRSNKRKRVQALKADSLFKILVDTILNDPKKLPEGLEPPRSEYPSRDTSSSCDKDLLPLVFSFGGEDTKAVINSEYEGEMGNLWADFDFALQSKSIGCCHIGEGQAEEVNIPEVEADPTTLCPKTEKEHQFILDDQIGIRCKFCSYVKQYVKDILPSWVTRFSEKSARTNAAYEEDHLIFDDLCRKARNYGNQVSSDLVDGTVWNLIPGIDKTMYPHQREAFEFMWRNLAGGIQLDKLKSCSDSDDTGGCVVSHPPGTGKTRLAIVFIQTYMKLFPECRPVIIAPCGILLTWKKEFKKWDVNLPFHLLNLPEYSGKEDNAVCELVRKEPKSRNWIRIVKLYSWAKGNGILGLSYGLFKRLTDERLKNSLKGAEISKILLEKPGLIILDEGHTPRNDRTCIWKALEKLKTEQRIILSGTPFQNNFGELYNTLCLVRPKFAEKILPKTLKLCQRRADFLSDIVQDIFPVRNEVKKKWSSRTNHISVDSLEELRSMIKPFVHVYNGKILENLPGLRDCLIVLDPLPQQKCILEKIDDVMCSSPFEYEYKVSMASIHPSLMTYVHLSEREKSLIDEHSLDKLRMNPNEGVKTRFVMELVRLSAALKEKVIVFSQYLQPLSMIRDQLIKQFNWIEGRELLRMDGTIPSKHRQCSIESFNCLASEARVLLASTKACCEGISLTGASRVVLLDIVWNPSVERQAISRAYRIGQEKVVYTYRLIASGTGECDKYETQTKKNHQSKLVFSPEIDFNNIKNSSSQAEEEHVSKSVSEDKILEVMTGHDNLKDMFVKIYYPSKKLNVMSLFG